MKRASVFLATLLLLLSALGSTACSKKGGDNAAVKHPVDELFRLCKESNFAEVARHLIYRGKDQSRNGKDVYDYAKEEDKEEVEAACRYLTGIARNSYSVGELKEITTGPNAGTSASEVIFKISGDERKQYFIFRKINDRHALIDIDEQPPIGMPGVVASSRTPATPPPFPTTTPDETTGETAAGENLDSKAISKPVPPYPAVARAARAEGTVTVEVTVDEQGRVTSARATKGHPLLRAAAEQAARSAQFKPSMENGKPVKVMGVLTYNFSAQ